MAENTSSSDKLAAFAQRFAAVQQQQQQQQEQQERQQQKEGNEEEETNADEGATGTHSAEQGANTTTVQQEQEQAGIGQQVPFEPVVEPVVEPAVEATVVTTAEAPEAPPLAPASSSKSDDPSNGPSTSDPAIASTGATDTLGQPPHSQQQGPSEAPTSSSPPQGQHAPAEPDATVAGTQPTPGVTEEARREAAYEGQQQQPQQQPPPPPPQQEQATQYQKQLQQPPLLGAQPPMRAPLPQRAPFAGAQGAAPFHQLHQGSTRFAPPTLSPAQPFRGPPPPHHHLHQHAPPLPPGQAPPPPFQRPPFSQHHRPPHAHPSRGPPHPQPHMRRAPPLPAPSSSASPPLPPRSPQRRGPPRPGAGGQLRRSPSPSPQLRQRGRQQSPRPRRTLPPPRARSGARDVRGGARYGSRPRRSASPRPAPPPPSHARARGRRRSRSPPMHHAPHRRGAPSPPPPPLPAAPSAAGAVSAGREREIPPNSRIFVARLKRNQVTKADLEQVFSKYGRILEIRLNHTYGFVQFDNPRSARAAIDHEKGRRILGIPIDLNLATNKFPTYDTADGVRRAPSPPPSPPRPAPPAAMRPRARRHSPSPIRSDQPPPKVAKRSGAPDCVLVIHTTKPALKRTAVELRDDLMRRNVHTETTALRPSEHLSDVLRECRADGAVVAAVLFAPSPAGQTLDIHVLQGQREVRQRVPLSDSAAIISHICHERSGPSPSAPPAPAVVSPPRRPPPPPQPQPQSPYRGAYRTRGPQHHRGHGRSPRPASPPPRPPQRRQYDDHEHHDQSRPPRAYGRRTPPPPPPPQQQQQPPQQQQQPPQQPHHQHEQPRPRPPYGERSATAAPVEYGREVRGGYSSYGGRGDERYAPPSQPEYAASQPQPGGSYGYGAGEPVAGVDDYRHNQQYSQRGAPHGDGYDSGAPLYPPLQAYADDRFTDTAVAAPPPPNTHQQQQHRQHPHHVPSSAGGRYYEPRAALPPAHVDPYLQQQQQQQQQQQRGGYDHAYAEQPQPSYAPLDDQYRHYQATDSAVSATPVSALSYEQPPVVASPATRTNAHTQSLTSQIYKILGQSTPSPQSPAPPVPHSTAPSDPRLQSAPNSGGGGGGGYRPAPRPAAPGTAAAHQRTATTTQDASIDLNDPAVQNMLNALLREAS